MLTLIDESATTKSVFRAAMEGLVPAPILARRDKIGFNTPQDSWLRAVSPWVHRVLDSERAKSIPAVNQSLLASMSSDMLAGRNGTGQFLWRWLNLTRWSDLMQVEF